VPPTRHAPLADRTTFADPELQAAFEREGFVVLPFLDAAGVEALRATWAEVGDPAGAGFQTDFEQREPARKQLVHDRVIPLVGDRLDALFDRHRPFMTSFLAKWPGTGSALYVHQDWAYVDERRYRSAVVWIALDDADEERGNGPLRVLPGSHRVAGEHRGTRTSPWHADHPHLIDASLVSVPVRAGDAVIMDNALVHASPDNGTAEVRLAVAVAVIPVEAELIHAAIDPDGVLSTWTVDDSFFRHQTPSLLRERLPTDLPPSDLEPVPTWRPPDPDLMARLVGSVDLSADAEPLGGSQPAPPTGSLLDQAIGRLLAWNHRALARHADPGPFLDPAAFPWLAPLQAAHATLAREYLAADAGASGASALELQAGAALPNRGSWDALILYDNLGRASGWDRCPETAALLEAVPGLRSAMFSVLGPWARIGRHRGSNKGVLRAHVGVLVPDPPGRVALWAGADHRTWAPGSGFVFDDTYEHRVANRTDGWRVSLMVEFDRPLEGWDRWRNRAVQVAFRGSPQVRGSRERRRDIERALGA
jgi:beta-hydroxylase